MTVLVTGGAGYIGAHIVRVVQGQGRPVIVVDDFSSGHPSRVKDVPTFELDLAEPSTAALLTEVLRSFDVTAVIHLAARKVVSESIARPAWYFQQNVTGLTTVLAAMEHAHVSQLVFSSSAAVYGDPRSAIVSEESATIPVSPYGQTKLAGEWLVRDAARAWGLRGVSLRYFNVAGAGWPDLGDPAVLNLVTMVLERLARGERPVVFGVDYPTPDGSCVRDFVHVRDVADAHVACLDYLTRAHREWDVFNIGTGRGASVLDVIDGLIEVSGAPLRPLAAPRRAGDAANFVASVDRIAAATGWHASFELPAILSSAWQAWQANHAPAPQ